MDSKLGLAPTQRISEEIPWTKQVGVEALNRENFRRNSTDKAS